MVGRSVHDEGPDTLGQDGSFRPQPQKWFLLTKAALLLMPFCFVCLFFPSEEKESWIVGHLQLPKGYLLSDSQ